MLIGSLTSYDLYLFSNITLKICIVATFYLQLRNAIIIYYISLFGVNKGQISCFDIIEH